MKRYWLMLLTLLPCCTEDEPGGTPVVTQDFNAYPGRILSATATPDGGYLLTGSAAITKLDAHGTVVWEHREPGGIYTQAMPAHQGGTIALKRLVTPQKDTIESGGGVVVADDRDTVMVALQLQKLDDQGLTLWQRTYTVATSSNQNDRYFSQMANYALPFINYGLGVEDAGGNMFVALCYDGFAGQHTRFKLLKIAPGGDLVLEKDFSMNSYGARIYAFDLAGGKLILSRGGPDWYGFDVFTTGLDVIESVRHASAFSDPTFNSIHTLPDGTLAFTGQVDKRNNENIVTNYDCALAFGLQAGDDQLSTFGNVVNRELCLASTLDQEGNIVLLTSQRGAYQVTQSADSDVILMVYDRQGELINYQVVSQDHSLEGSFIHLVDDHTFVIIGTKNGFDSGEIRGDANGQTDDQTFFMRVTLIETRKNITR